MKLFILMLALLSSVSGAIHSLRYCETAFSSPLRFPEFVADGLVDHVPVVHYDSNTMRAEPRQDWMSRVVEDEPDYWEHETRTFIGYQLLQRANLKILGERFNHTGGHVSQKQYGCEWNDETGELKGYERYGYDGEDFITFDLQNMTWIPGQEQALVTKEKWDTNTYQNTKKKNYLSQVCPQWLKRYLDYGKSSLLRKELPIVSLLQKVPSSPVICHATGFYPDWATLFWRKDGQEIKESVGISEVLPNPDGTFQTEVELKLSDPSEDWGRYQCVFQLQGVKEDLVTQLDRDSVLTNRHHEHHATNFDVLEELNPHQDNADHERPSVSLLQKKTSSPVVCHTTGFYPSRATMIWRRSREELHQYVEIREILPNPDGTFQMRADCRPL
ncbi:major histocompatibility complex class I-related gene protein-like [Synchiropus picturatus]